MKLTMVLIGCSLLLASQTSAATLEEKKAAFLSGFMSTPISGRVLRESFAAFSTTPEQFKATTSEMFKKTTSPVLSVAFRKETDSIGRLVVYPQVRYQLMSPEIFPSAAYLYSILDFQKDALILSGKSETLSKKTLDIYEVQP